jgi:hypothetical protein
MDCDPSGVSWLILEQPICAIFNRRIWMLQVCDKNV